MGVYSRYLFPRVIDRVMARAPLTELRPQVLADVHGDVLEIGFGSGLNLPHYPPQVRRLTVLEPNVGMHRRSMARIEASSIEVDVIGLLDGRDIGASDQRFDTVVSTWTMCTIADVAHALREVRRVLRPGGRLVFVEHGLATPDPGVQKWQRRLNPINRWIGDGCNLDRDIGALLRASPLKVDRLDTFYLRDTPRLGGYTYRGTATRIE